MNKTVFTLHLTTSNMNAAYKNTAVSTIQRNHWAVDTDSDTVTAITIGIANQYSAL